MLGCNTAKEESLENQANKLFVEASLYQHLGQYDKEYDALKSLVETYPGTDVSMIGKLELKELKKKVFNGGIKKDSEKYPQSTYQDLLKSIIKAINNKDGKYLFFHLSQYGMAPYIGDNEQPDTIQEMLDEDAPKMALMVEKIQALLDNTVQLEFEEASPDKDVALYVTRLNGNKALKLVHTNNNYYWYLR